MRALDSTPYDYRSLELQNQTMPGCLDLGDTLIDIRGFYHAIKNKNSSDP